MAALSWVAAITTIQIQIVSCFVRRGRSREAVSLALFQLVHSIERSCKATKSASASENSPYSEDLKRERERERGRERESERNLTLLMLDEEHRWQGKW